MKARIVIGAMIAASLLLVHPAEASTYIENGQPVRAGTCKMVNLRSEADATHVYTLNPDHTIKLNQAYVDNWSRNATCSELQFHVDHSTPLVRLGQWLGGVAQGWYANLKNSHFEGQTISTSTHEWFLVKDGELRRIPDWLTALSNGLMIDDRLSIPTSQTNVFYQLTTVGTPVQFSAGQYVNTISDIWETENDIARRNLIFASDLPSSIKGELDYFDANFQNCQEGNSLEGVVLNDPRSVLLDWSWKLHNPICQ